VANELQSSGYIIINGNKEEFNNLSSKFYWLNKVVSAIRINQCQIDRTLTIFIKTSKLL